MTTSVREYLESRDEEERVTLIVGINTDADTASEQIAKVGGEVEDTLPYDSLAVSVSVDHLEDICDVDAVSSVELEKTYGTRGGSDFLSP